MVSDIDRNEERCGESNTSSLKTIQTRDIIGDVTRGISVMSSDGAGAG